MQYFEKNTMREQGFFTGPKREPRHVMSAAPDSSPGSFPACRGQQVNLRLPAASLLPVAPTIHLTGRMVTGLLSSLPRPGLPRRRRCAWCTSPEGELRRAPRRRSWRHHVTNPSSSGSTCESLGVYIFFLLCSQTPLSQVHSMYLLKTNTSPTSRHFWVDDFPNFPWWDMLVPWRVSYISYMKGEFVW